MWQLLIHPMVPYVFCSIIFSIFFYVLLRYDRRDKLLVSQSITNTLNALDVINDRQTFFEQYESLGKKLLEDKVFHDAWAEFDETVIVDNENQKIITTKRPHDYFNEFSIISPRIDLRLIHAVPNYLVGLGLLFTFIGLVAAIHFAAGGLGSTDGGKQALKNLLQMASVKFLSSIAGLFCSILLSVFQKRWLNNLNNKIYDICRKIEKLTDSITIEQLLTASLKDQKDQTDTLKHLATEIAMQIGDALAEKFPTSVAAAMQPLAEALNNTAQKLTATNHEGLEQMLSSFTNKLDGATQNEIQELVGGLKNIQGSLEGLLKHIQDTGEAFGNNIIGAAGELGNTLMPVTDKLLTFNDNIQQINEKMYAQLDRFDSNISSLNSTLQNIKDTADHMHQAGLPVSSAAEGIKLAARSIESSHKQIQDTHSNSQQATLAMQRASEKVETVWDSYEDRFKSVDQDMVKAFSSIQDGLEAFKKNIGDFVSQFDDKFRSAISLLEGAIRELTDERETSKQFKDEVA